MPESGAARVSPPRRVNLLGEEVSRLFEGELAAGEHTFTWEPGVGPAAPHRAGVYWCEVRMNGRVERAGMVVAEGN